MMKLLIIRCLWEYVDSSAPSFTWRLFMVEYGVSGYCGVLYLSSNWCNFAYADVTLWSYIVEYDDSTRDSIVT